MYFVRAFSERQIDDVSPGIDCDPLLLEKSDVLYVIPDFEGKDIAEDSMWCSEILDLDKELSLHGVFHNYKEFNEEYNNEEFKEGLNSFKDCFGKYPVDFKPPQLAISLENKEMIERDFDLKVRARFNQLFHKVYHCEDTGVFSNEFIDWF